VNCELIQFIWIKFFAVKRSKTQ